MADEEHAKGPSIERDPAPAEEQWLSVGVQVDPRTRSMRLVGGLPNEVVIEMLSRALRYAERQQLLVELKEVLAGPKIVDANGGPVGHARRFLR